MGGEGGVRLGLRACLRQPPPILPARSPLTHTHARPSATSCAVFLRRHCTHCTPCRAQNEAVENRELASRGEEGNKEHWTAPANPGAHDPRGMKSWVTCAAPPVVPALERPCVTQQRGVSLVSRVRVS